LKATALVANVDQKQFQEKTNGKKHLGMK